MSDSELNSHDSQAAWKALGDRMRSNRRWLLVALLSLGMYMAAQAWVHWPGEGALGGTLAANVELADAVLSHDANDSKLARSADHRKSDAESAPKATTEHVGTVQGTAKTIVPPIRQRQPERPAAKRNHSVTRPAARSPAGGPAVVPVAERSYASDAESLGVFLGQSLAECHAQSAESRRDGIQIAVSAIAHWAHASREMSAAGSVAKPDPVEPTRPGVQTDDASSTTSHVANTSGLLLTNPSDSGGLIRYLVNGDEHTLEPGGSQHLHEGRWLIEFHRGGEFGETAYTLRGGSYRFEVTERGWDLRGEQ
jgi:hypothetical protein